METEGTLRATLEAAKRLKVGILDLIPAFLALAKGEGLVKATISAIKWTALSAVIPIATGVGAAFVSMTAVIRKLVIESGSLDAAIKKIGETKQLEKVFTPLLKGADAAQERVAELFQFAQETPFDLKGAAEASHTLQLLGPSSLAFGAGLKTVGDVAAATGNKIEDVAGELATLHSELKSGADISASVASLKSMGVVTEETARQIMRLQESGAGMSIIWSKVTESMASSSGGIRKANEEIGNLQGRLEKTRENLKASFGQPFIDAEKTGIKNTIQTMQNLEPALKAVAAALSEVTSATSNIKTGFTAWATSVPHLSDLMGGITRIITNFGIAIAAIGAGELVGRLKNIGSFLGELRASTGAKSAADYLLSSSAKHLESVKNLKAAAAAATEAGDTKLAVKLTAQAGVATVRGGAAKVGAAALGDVGAIRGLVGGAAGAVGRFFATPWFIVPALVSHAVSAVQSINKAQAANREEVKKINDAGMETIRGLDDQISKITTLDDKYRAIVDATNAIAAARSKLSTLKLPSDDQHLSILQRTINALEKIPGLLRIANTVRQAFGLEDLKKQESLSTVQQRAVGAQIKALEGRRAVAQAVPEEQLVTQRNVELAGRRAVFERQRREAETEMQLQTAQTPAARAAILARQSETLTSRAQTGKAEATKFDTAERALGVLENKLTEPMGKFGSATEKLENMGETSKEVERRNEIMMNRAATIREQHPGMTQETAIAKAAEQRIPEVQKHAATIEADARKFLQATGTPITKATLHEETKKRTAESSDEISALNKIISQETQITDIRNTQAALRRKDQSELEQITQAIDDIAAHKPAHVFDEKVGGKDLERLSARKALLDIDVKAENQEKDLGEAARKTFEQKQEEKKARLEKPDIAAEKEILAIRDEGLDREQKMTEIEDKRNQAERVQIKKERTIEGAAAGTEEEDPRLRAVAARDEENRRHKEAIANERQEIEFRRQSLIIETTTGRGPAEEIKSLEAQLDLTKQEMAATANNKTLSKQAAQERLTELAKSSAMMNKAISDIKFNRDQELAAAKSQTLQVELQAKGLDYLAHIEEIRLSTTQKIAQAIREGNTELAKQAQIQGSIATAQALGHHALGGLVRDERTGELREQTGKERAQEARDEAAIQRHAQLEQTIGENRKKNAAEIIAKGGSTTDYEAVAALNADKSAAQEATKQAAAKKQEEKESKEWAALPQKIIDAIKTGFKEGLQLPGTPTTAPTGTAPVTVSGPSESAPSTTVEGGGEAYTPSGNEGIVTPEGEVVGPTTEPYGNSGQVFQGWPTEPGETEQPPAEINAGETPVLPTQVVTGEAPQSTIPESLQSAGNAVVREVKGETFLGQELPKVGGANVPTKEETLPGPAEAATPANVPTNENVMPSWVNQRIQDATLTAEGPLPSAADLETEAAMDRAAQSNMSKWLSSPARGQHMKSPNEVIPPIAQPPPIPAVPPVGSGKTLLGPGPGPLSPAGPINLGPPGSSASDDGLSLDRGAYDQRGVGVGFDPSTGLPIPPPGQQGDQGPQGDQGDQGVPAQPSEPQAAQPAGQAGAQSGDLAGILKEIKASIDNFSKRIGVA